MSEDFALLINSYEHQDRFYLCNLVSCEIIEVDALTHKVVHYLRENPNTDAIEIHEQTDFPTDAIEEILTHLKDYMAATQPLPETSSDRLKLLVKGYPEADISRAVAGSMIVWHTLIDQLSEHCDIYHLEEDLTAQRPNSIVVNRNDLASLVRLNQEHFDAVLCPAPTSAPGFNIEHLVPLVRYLNCPLIIRTPCVRGHNGDFINGTLMWYALMRDFDRLVAASHAVKRFYADLTEDSSIFTVIRNGVDRTLFKPMDKISAKKQVATQLDDRRIESHPIVGFLSRFQPEKGAGYYISLAKRNPDYLFLVVVPTLGPYQLGDLPQNLIYAGPQKRSVLPLFFNAFDVYCYPSVVGEEVFSNAILEAMACRIPVVAGRISGLPEAVQDGGILVDCETFSHEIGSIAGYISVDALEEAIRGIICDDAKREELAEKALRRAQQLDWSTTAAEFISLIRSLQQQRQVVMSQQSRTPPVLFSNYYPVGNSKKHARSHLISLIGFDNEHALMRAAYTQSVEEGVTLSLMRNHSVREVEAVANTLFANDETDTLHRVKRFVQTIG